LKESVKTLATSLLMKQLRYPDSHFLESLKRRTGISDNLIDAIRELLVRNTSQLFLDKAIILKNRSIDPRFQNDLYLELKLGFEPLPFPLDPLFYQRICWIFQKISKHLFRISDNRYKYYAYLASRWILEDSYKSLIEGKISHNRETGRDLGTSEKSFVNRMIDELDEDIETTLKYDYTRTLKCYQDITEGIRRMMGDNRPFCRELPIFLEEGTFKRNTLFLLEAGFSRNVAKAIADLMGETKLGSSTQTVEWIKLNMNKIKGELPEFYFVELEDVLNRYGAN